MTDKFKLYQENLHKSYLLTNQGKLEEFKKYLAPDISWTEAAGFPYAGTYIGSDEVVKNVHQKLGTEWANYNAQDISYAFNGNTVMVYGKYSGKYKATGKEFVADFVHIYEFNADNKVQKFIQVVDSAIVINSMK